MIKRNHRVSLASLALVLGVGCGATSSLDLCHATCAYQQRCGGLTDAQAANCNSDCEARKGTFQDQDVADDKRCSNAASVRQQGLNCLNMDCNKVATCVATLDITCVTR